MTKKQGIRRFLILLGAIPLFFIGRVAFSQEPELAPLNPEFVQYQQNLQQKIFLKQATKEGHGLGFIPPPIDLSYLKGQKILQFQGKSSSFDLPSSYDLRVRDDTFPDSRLTSIRDQDGYGTCWAFATYGSMESCLLPGEDRDFSENNLANLHGFDFDVDDGGDQFMSTAYLGRWAGPVNESDDPYVAYPDHQPSPSGLTVQKHIQEVLFLPDRGGSDDNIKWAVVTYGAVFTSMFWDSACYNSTNTAYYYSGENESNHAVCIVGWDDAYPASNFNTPLPLGNGAFIVRNSWGTDWGEAGYFYVSYYDSNFGKDNAVFNNAEATVNYKDIYQYDPLGLVRNIGYNSNTGWFSNIFIATGNQFLNAVSFYTAALDSAYEIDIRTGVDVGQPGSGSIAGIKTGTIAIPGYHTIVLDSSVSLTSGQRFLVVVKLTTPGYNFPIPIECPEDGYSSQATANPGESFISSKGSDWSDLPTINGFENTNVCLKAFTSAIPISGGGGGGGGAVGPLTAGISALLGWRKRRKQKQG